MKKQTLIQNLILFLLLLTAALATHAQEQPGSDSLTILGSGQRYNETIPVIDIQAHGYRPLSLPTNTTINHLQLTVNHSSSRGGGSDPNNPYAIIRKTGPTFLSPGGTAQYAITLNNFESITRTYQLTETLPVGLTYLPDSNTELAYDANTRTLSWQGELAPGNLDYIIEEHSPALPYLDLADFGAVNLCDDFIANGEPCDNVTVTFNLGVNGYTTNLYGELLSQLTVSSNGLIVAPETAVSSPSNHNQFLPDAATPGFVLAGLWGDTDMGDAEGQNGRFHAAIISGLIEGHDVFYAQWHDVPHTSKPDLTARHAIALLLNGDDSFSGHAFFIYDNISDPAQLVAQGYTIGIADKLGSRGATYAYAPCCDDGQPPQGFPPAAGTTLHLRPFLFGAENDYQRTFSYAALVNAPVPETVVSTAVATSSSPDPALAYAWSTHYLYVRRQLFLPLTFGGSE
ncbi:MAG: DUF11 domain-containing protein [Ardenticatenaceae bacterium]|nr:DUF11 domain-containing protein [Anaerolineales bacterium]MCB9005950.1 DUF11 domain-containing protein [Ardenticatenaceae bacterium]